MRREQLHVHVERLVLDGLELGAGDAPRVAAALDRELVRLLAADGRAPEAMRADSLVARLRGPDLALPAGATADGIGAGLAAAVHAQITRPGAGNAPAPSGGRR